MGEREVRTETVVSSVPKSVIHAYRYHRRVAEVSGVCTMVVGSRLVIRLFFIRILHVYVSPTTKRPSVHVYTAHNNVYDFVCAASRRYLR